MNNERNEFAALELVILTIFTGFFIWIFVKLMFL